jgi:thiazole synthase
MTGTITVTVNGQDRHVPTNSTLLELLDTLELDPRGVVVEHNRGIVRRPELDSATLADGDSVEIVHFVGGG